MPHPIRFVLTLHNHQPIGNFDRVVEQAYHDGYRPFLETLARYPTLKVSLHTSGSLLDWLERRHPEYLDLLAELAERGQVEILGGALYEPILPMIPRRDRRGQIARMSQRLERRFGTRPLGMWLTERVWEQQLASDLAASGIEHIVLDDCHFTSAGLNESQLRGYYLTEDDGQVIAAFPGSERLRYLIPFAPPQETIDYLRAIAETQAGSVVVFGDDGEKFGAWPGMKEHVFDRGWLVQFFDALVANSDWLHVTTLAEAVNHVKPLGKIYLPDSSYREMNEWAAIPQKAEATKSMAEPEKVAEVADDTVPLTPGPSPTSGEVRQVTRSSWRNFLVKYPEAGEMYARMLLVSRRLAAAAEAGHDAETIEAARRELYRGQCNCAYWHGTYGGVYLPHLRQAAYRHLIAADALLDRASHTQAWVSASQGDLNQDVHKEILLTNDKLSAFFSPEQGGALYELDVKATCQNLLATMARRMEPYHAVGSNGAKSPASGEALRYDSRTVKSLVDRFYDARTTLADIVSGEADELGDFATGRYESHLARDARGIRLELTRQGTVDGCPVRITRRVTLAAGSSALEIDYQLEGLPADRSFQFAVELNFAGLAGVCSDRKGQSLGQLGQTLELSKTKAISLVDEHVGIDVQLKLSRSGQVATYPIRTQSRYELGSESIQQSVVVLPHWLVRGDAHGCWSVSLQLAIDTSAAESRLTHAFDHADLGLAEMARTGRAQRFVPLAA
jgi:alpha-amylase